jgi:hypothetical protein
MFGYLYGEDTYGSAADIPHGNISDDVTPPGMYMPNHPKFINKNSNTDCATSHTERRN